MMKMKLMKHHLYKGYRPDKKWIIVEIFKLFSIWFGASYLFYNTYKGLVFTIPLVPVLFFADFSDYQVRQRKQLLTCFKDVLTLVSGNLNVGYSLENAWIVAREDYEKLYGKNYMVIELEHVVNGITNGKSLSALLKDFAIRSGLEEVAEFSRILEIAGKYGGNIISIIRQTNLNMNDRKAVSEEIDTLVSSKRMESNIMTAMPFVILIYLRLTNPDYLDIVYETISGKAIMTVSAVLITGAYMWNRKILKVINEY